MKPTVLVLMVMMGACGDDRGQPVDASVVDASVDAGRTPVERGRYIMNTLGACTFCHTPLNPDGTRNLNRLFAGWSCADPIPFLDIDPATTGVGCLSTRNLTNDPTGLKNATDQQIKDAIRNGVRTDGKIIVPVMPYYLFHNMTDDDVDAIVAYLRTVPGVSNTVPPNEPPWTDVNDNVTTSPLCNGGACKATNIALADIPLPVDPPDMASAMRGRYLTGMVGLCIDCHTPNYPQGAAPFPPLFPAPIDTSGAFTGGRKFAKSELGLVDPAYPASIYVTNLTPDATGLAGYSVEQLKAAIADGKDKDGKAVCAATHGTLISPYAGLDPQDLEDIAAYIHALPPVARETMATCQGPAVP